MKAKSALIASIATVGIASSAMADSVSNNTPGGWASTGSYSTVIVLPAVTSIDSIVVNFAHTVSSDLDISITGPGGASFDLWNNNGFFNNFGTSASNDLAVNLPAAYWWGQTGIPNSTYFSGSPDPIPSGQANQIAANTWTGGALPAGNYTITMSDTVGGDGANILGWTINYTAVPTPGAMALLGLAGMVGRRRRR